MLSQTTSSDLETVVLFVLVLVGLGFLLAAGIIDLVGGDDRTRKVFIIYGVAMIILAVLWYIFLYLKFYRYSHKVYDEVVRLSKTDPEFRAYLDKMAADGSSTKGNVSSIPLRVMDSVPASNSPVVLPVT